MGKSKLFGGGSGKPVNAVKVTELAGEDIPANCFVKKVSGTSGGILLSSYAEYCSAMITERIFVYVVYSSSKFLLYVFLDDTQVASEDLSTYYVSGNNEKWVILKEKKTLLWFAENYTIIFEFEEDGTYTKTIKEASISAPKAISGRYSSGDVIYAFGYVKGDSMKTTGPTIQRWQISEDWTFTLISESSNLPYGTDVGYTGQVALYIEEADLIIKGDTSSTYTACVFKASTAQLLQTYTDDKGTFATAGYIGSAISIFSTSKYVVANDSVYLAMSRIGKTLDGSAYNAYIGKFDVNTGEYSEIAIENLNNTSANIYVSGIAHLRGAYYVAFWIADSYYIKIGKINIENMSYMGDVAFFSVSSAENANYPSTCLTYYKASLLLKITQQTIGKRTLKYTYPHIEISDGTVYGISSSKIDNDKYGNVYCVDTSYPNAAYTTYGIPETLATQIIDDSVDEIKQEVQNG